MDTVRDLIARAADPATKPDAMDMVLYRLIEEAEKDPAISPEIAGFFDRPGVETFCPNATDRYLKFCREHYGTGPGN